MIRAMQKCEHHDKSARIDGEQVLHFVPNRAVADFRREILS
jgi:hypothetical protein